MELSIVVPCYNEESVLPETARRLAELLQKLIAGGTVRATSRIYFVDDGSTDATWSMVAALAARLPCIKGIKLSRNCGHQLALLAGLLTVPGDAVISIDADLQDDLDAIEHMIDAHAKGSEIVYGVRKKRDTDTLLKRFTAEGYYRLLGVLGVEVVFNHADYRLMSRRALNALSAYEEVNVFLRGMIPQLGFRTSTVYYDRQERFAGESKYTLRKMLALAWNGITSFSPTPLRIITAVGFVIAMLSLALSAWALTVRLLGYYTVPGWASSVVAIYFLGGLQLFSIGLIGEYLAKIYLEVKRRPRFQIETTV
ncbi:MAG TPA: glycosyltransferase family 2 protein [Steroidobacteraceae bacterium]|nr:glycosyltransferase family 2 protein [Steroidobacteraceae bacterium]